MLKLFNWSFGLGFLPIRSRKDVGAEDFLNDIEPAFLWFSHVSEEYYFLNNIKKTTFQ